MSRPPDAFSRFYKLALELKGEGRMEPARENARQALAVGKKTLPPTHPDLKRCQELLDLLSPGKPPGPA
jgi:hypothetical protein